MGVVLPFPAPVGLFRQDNEAAQGSFVPYTAEKLNTHSHFVLAYAMDF